MSRKSKKVESESLNISAAQQAYVRRHLIRIRWVRFYQFLILITFIAVWEITAQLGILNSFVFSSPSRVTKTIIEMTASGQLLYHVGITLLETLFSFALVNVVGIVMAVILWWNDSISKVLEPYLIVLNSLPKSALAPVFIVWLGNNMKTIIVAAVSVATVTIVQLLFCTNKRKYFIIFPSIQIIPYMILLFWI
jgi:NitT/TauT family transport system permease protein